MQPISNCLAPPSRSYLKGGELIVYYTLTFDEVALTYYSLSLPLTKHSQKKYQGEPMTPCSYTIDL